ncbi:MAG: GDP-mannose mannosyl hydrolase [Rhodospirillaceae bacterium]|nr:GDP-mannose mannosyl hydrolase [Rhodospirillaceae bacterium]|tara:strand:- start:1756 stop:2250 length:495 start_codon:yes stop_codon:yes gene_type:complete
MWLDNSTFKKVVQNTPLISIDFILENAEGKILLGRRNNPPARDFWFVPGGRIQKDETLNSAFERLTETELKVGMSRNTASLVGVFEHFYPDSIFSSDSSTISTHYVVLAYHMRLDSNSLIELPSEQHCEYRWWEKRCIEISEKVHANTRAYLPSLDAANAPKVH